MKLFFSSVLVLFPLLLPIFAFGRVYAPAKFQVSTGNYFSCVLDDNGVHCWDNDQPNRVHKLNYEYPRAVALDDDLICAITDKGIECEFCRDLGYCTGRDSVVTHFFDVDESRDISAISVSKQRVCAIIKDRVQCVILDRSQPGVYSPRPPIVLKSPQELSASSRRICALDSEGVHCWETIDYSDGPNIKHISDLKNPRMVKAGDVVSCALDDEDIKCWDRDGRIKSLSSDKIKNLKDFVPSAISIDNSWVGVLDDEGVKWISLIYGNSSEILVDSQRGDPQMLSFHKDGNVCALYGAEVRCWDGKSEKPTFSDSSNFKLFLPGRFPFFHLDQITDYFSRISTTSNASRAKFIGAILSSVSQELSFEDRSLELTYSRYFTVKLAAPVILSNDSEFYQMTAVPEFHKSVLEFEAEMNVKNISEVPDSERNRRLALKVMYASLSGMVDFLSPQEGQKVQAVIVSVGRVLQSPMDNVIAKDLLKQSDTLMKQKNALRSSPKSAFLVDTLELAANWLREKVK